MMEDYISDPISLSPDRNMVNDGGAHVMHHAETGIYLARHSHSAEGKEVTFV